MDTRNRPSASRSNLFSRRGFMGGLAGLAGATLLPLPGRGQETGTAGDADADMKPLRFGVCADTHQDIMHDVEERLAVFIEDMAAREVDFILQLGDFCIPNPRNRAFMKVWEGFDGPRYHTLGNHDMDEGYSREQTREFWGMPANYYSFDKGGFHIVVLDGNDVKEEGRVPGYARYIGPKQQEWLRADLAATTLPTLVFSHQSLENRWGVQNGREMRRLLEEANAEAGWRKVFACVAGHNHIDYDTYINGIEYIMLNSMSYRWLGGKYARQVYSPHIHRAHRAIQYTAPYRDPLYAVFTLDRAGGTMRIEGRDSEYVGPSPWERNHERPEFKDRIVPLIRDKVFPI